MAGFAESRLQLLKSTIARWIWLMKAKFAMLIRNYFGAKTKGYDSAMRKATRGHPLSYEDEMRNKKISRKRSFVERYFAFAKRICKAGHVAVTTIGRVR